MDGSHPAWFPDDDRPQPVDFEVGVFQVHGDGGPLFVAVRQAAAPHFEVERQPVGQERFGEGLEVDAHQLFKVLVFVERAVLRQVDNAVEPPDSAQGFAEGIGSGTCRPRCRR